MCVCAHICTYDYCCACVHVVSVSFPIPSQQEMVTSGKIILEFAESVDAKEVRELVKEGVGGEGRNSERGRNRWREKGKRAEGKRRGKMEGEKRKGVHESKGGRKGRGDETVLL